MVRAWYMNNNENEDQRKPRMLDPTQFLNLDELREKTGVVYYKVDVDNLDSCTHFAQIKHDHGYTYEDVCDISKDTLPDYDSKLKIFFTEHLHSDEEIRLIMAGSGYFDLRDKDDKWIRVEVVKDDMLIVPAGIYHRFTLDEKNYIQARRFFVGEPVWTPINRPEGDSHWARAGYLKTMGTV